MSREKRSFAQETCVKSAGKAMARDASAPGGQAVMGILKAADITPKVLANVPEQGSCVQRSVESVAEGKADAMLFLPRMTAPASRSCCTAKAS